MSSSLVRVHVDVFIDPASREPCHAGVLGPARELFLMNHCSRAGRALVVARGIVFEPFRALPLSPHSPPAPRRASRSRRAHGSRRALPDARLGLFGAARATPAPSEEDEGGLTRERLAILVAHLTLSVAHIFAVHQSAKGEDAGEGDPSAGAARSYAYNPAMVVLTVRAGATPRGVPEPSPRVPSPPPSPPSHHLSEGSIAHVSLEPRAARLSLSSPVVPHPRRPRS